MRLVHDVSDGDGCRQTAVAGLRGTWGHGQGNGRMLGPQPLSPGGDMSFIKYGLTTTTQYTRGGARKHTHTHKHTNDALLISVPSGDGQTLFLMTAHSTLGIVGY